MNAVSDYKRAAVWIALQDYDGFVWETENEWEQKYRFQHLTEHVRKGEQSHTKAYNDALRTYNTNIRTASSQQALLEATLTSAQTRLYTLVESLCDA